MMNTFNIPTFSSESDRLSEEEWITEIHGLLQDWINSGISAQRFCKIIGFSAQTFYAWKQRFTPGHPNADERWMEIGGPIEYRYRKGKHQILEIRKRWLDYCEALKVNSGRN